MVEQSAVNRSVVGSSPTVGAFFFFDLLVISPPADLILRSAIFFQIRLCPSGVRAILMIRSTKTDFSEASKRLFERL